MVQNKVETLEKFLIENGVAAKEITKASPDITDTQSELYTSNKHPFRYVVTEVVTVATKDVDKIRDIMSKNGELLKKGIAISESDYRYRKVFSFNGLGAIKPEMIEEANKNARTAAQKFAMDSGSKLGKIKTATQGQFSIEDRDENTPFIKKASSLKINPDAMGLSRILVRDRLFLYTFKTWILRFSIKRLFLPSRHTRAWNARGRDSPILSTRWKRCRLPLP